MNQPGNCHFCGDLECDLQACADCHKSFCPECIDWCCNPEDEANGDYFCVNCQDESDDRTED
jgi:hypothetical protein